MHNLLLVTVFLPVIGAGVIALLRRAEIRWRAKRRWRFRVRT